MNLWQLIDGLIRRPPLILIAVLIAIMAAHALKIAFEFITKREQSNSLIITLELIVVIVLGYLAIHLHVEKFMAGSEQTGSHNEPFWMVCLLILFTFVSMIVYIFYRAAIQDKG